MAGFTEKRRPVRQINDGRPELDKRVSDYERVFAAEQGQRGTYPKTQSS